MKIGVDSSILVAGVHANHPLHSVAAGWLINNIPLHELMVSHHSIVETYAVLTRLPGELRLTGLEVKQLLETTVKPNMRIADFSSSSIWDLVDSLVNQSVLGGRSYDAIIAEILSKSGADSIVTFNTKHFSEVAPQISIIDPSKPKPNEPEMKIED